MAWNDRYEGEKLIITVVELVDVGVDDTQRWSLQVFRDLMRQAEQRTPESEQSELFLEFEYKGDPYDYGGDAALRICRIESDAEQAVREAKYEQERIESVDRHRREKAASELKLLAELKAKYEA